MTTKTNLKPTNKKEKWLLVAMILSMCIWGTSWTCAKVIGTYTSSLNLTFLRFLLVTLSLIPIGFVTKTPLGIQKNGSLQGNQVGVIELKQDCAFVSVQSQNLNKILTLINNQRLKK